MVLTKLYPERVPVESTVTGYSKQWLFKTWLCSDPYGFVKILSGWGGIPAPKRRSRDQVFTYCSGFFQNHRCLELNYLRKEYNFWCFTYNDNQQFKTLPKITFLWDSHVILRAKQSNRLDSSVSKEATNLISAIITKKKKQTTINPHYYESICVTLFYFSTTLCEMAELFFLKEEKMISWLLERGIYLNVLIKPFSKGLQ